MDILNLVPKAFRLIQDETDQRFVVKRGTLTFHGEDEGDARPDTYVTVATGDVVLMSLVLPAQVEDNLSDMVRSFVMEREPVAEGTQVDFGYIKEKGRLKILASIIREDRYNQIREAVAEKTSELSGIVPRQNLYVMHALSSGIKEGLCLFREDDLIVGVYLKDAFPVAFLKTRQDRNPAVAIQRFLSAQRSDERVPVRLFGDLDELAEALPVQTTTAPAADLPEALSRLTSSRQMPMVNLLPVRERKVHRKLWRYIAGAVVILVLLGHGVLEVRDYLALRSEVNSLQETYDGKREEAMALRKKMDERDELRDKAQFYNRVTKQKTRIMNVLDELSRISPSDSYATSITIRSSGQLDFNGKSKDMFQLIRNLNESKMFSEVEKQGSSKQGSDGYTAFLVRGKIHD